jgi:hypothetical protein
MIGLRLVWNEKPAYYRRCGATFPEQPTTCVIEETRRWYRNRDQCLAVYHIRRKDSEFFLNSTDMAAKFH